MCILKLNKNPFDIFQYKSIIEWPVSNEFFFSKYFRPEVANAEELKIIKIVIKQISTILFIIILKLLI